MIETQSCFNVFSQHHSHAEITNITTNTPWLVLLPPQLAQNTVNDALVLDRVDYLNSTNSQQSNW